MDLSPLRLVLIVVAVLAILAAIGEVIGPAVAVLVLIVCAVLAFGPWLRGR